MLEDSVNRKIMEERISAIVKDTDAQNVSLYEGIEPRRRDAYDR